MQPNRTPNRSNEPARITPLEQAGRMPVLPTSRPARVPRHRGPINPVYIVLITVVPLAMLATMVWAAAGMFPRDETAGQAAAMIQISPTAEVATKLQLQYSKDAASQRREGDQVYITGQLTNTSNEVVHGAFLKAFLYAPGPVVVGSGIGNAVGDIAPGATVPFTVTAQLSSAPGVTLGTPTPPPLDFTTVDVQVDTVWLNTPTPVPAQ
jgi:hypothetical protein